jgi:predicted regulator of amino acid metabolism with ACT domain
MYITEMYMREFCSNLRVIKHLVDSGVSARLDPSVAACKEVFIETVAVNSEINCNLIPLRSRHVDD